VGEDPLSGPGFGSFEAVQAGAVPAVSAFEGVASSRVVYESDLMSGTGVS
jgi:hypothetical protein